MLSRWFQGIIYCLALPINSITSTQVFYGLVGKDHDLEVRDEQVPFLTQSFFTCASKDNCDEVAKEHGKGEFKEVARKETIKENNFVYKKVKSAEVIEPAKSCQDAYQKGHKSTGVLLFYIPGLDFVYVRCDMVTDGGGWIVFQRRVDATVDFYRGWDEYKNGFGDLNGNFWLGLEKIHKLTSLGKRTILRVDMKHVGAPNITRYAEYSVFKVGSEPEEYKLTVSGYSGNAGDSLWYHTGMKFSTKDRDNDLANEANCAQKYHGSWWFNACYHSNLNGIFPQQNELPQNCITWFNLYNEFGGVIFSEMKIKYYNP